MAAPELLSSAAQALALEAMAKLAAQVRAGGLYATSPCISVCRMDPQVNLCQGCFRSLDEICQWSKSDTAAKRQIWSRIEQRIQGSTA
jgi:predicted Fe-S protein YdhL (DUF1289 family)